jgi:multidrug efflux pump subunit AcrA (membrane-fusion protein)
MKVQASFPNPGSYLRPGQFARVRVAVAERENAILVPQRAIQELQGAKTVMIVDGENKVQVRTIKLGDKAENYYIVPEGLQSRRSGDCRRHAKGKNLAVRSPSSGSVASDNSSKKEGS